jgi:hypothetical protein
MIVGSELPPHGMKMSEFRQMRMKYSPYYAEKEGKRVLSVKRGAPQEFIDTYKYMYDDPGVRL